MSLSSGVLRDAPVPAPAPALDWRRLGRRSLAAGLIAVAVVQLLAIARGTQFGFDFRGGTWQAGHALWAGRSPYPPPVPAELLKLADGFITPPPLALLGAPFALLSFTPALILFNLLDLAAMAGALWVLGIRPRGSYGIGAYVLALSCFPMVSSLAMGQPDGLFALLTALAWRSRASWRGAACAGVLIAAKLVAWPLVIWLLATRRLRQAAVALGAGVLALAVSWAAIDFHGLAAFPALMRAETRAYGPKSHSLIAALSRSGLTLGQAELVAVALALGLGALVIAVSGDRDRGWFTAALLVGLLTSPVVWSHYLLSLFVVVAISARFRDPIVWLAFTALWLSPVESPPTTWQTWLVPVLVTVVAVRCVLSRPACGAGRLAAASPTFD